jgi:fucose 4-O-acetylase-like acetyltransferase
MTSTQGTIVAETARQRLLWLDYAKGLGILLVVAGHLMRGLVDNGVVRSEDTGYRWFDFTLYTFHMPLFFFLSGLTAAASLDKGRPQFIKGKLWTIAYPYVLWSIAFGILRVLFSSKGVTWDRLAWIPIYPMSIFWFLYVLLMCHLVFAFWPHQKRGWLLGLSVAAFAASEFVPETAKAVWPPLFMFFGAMPFYMAGHYLKDFAAKAPLKLWTVPALVAGFVVSVLVAHALVEWRYQSILVVPASLFGMAAIIALSRQVGHRAGAALAVLGAASMTIYVSHTLIASVARKVLERLSINDLPTNIAVLFVVCIALPVAAHYLLKRLGWLPVFGLASPIAPRRNVQKPVATGIEPAA